MLKFPTRDVPIVGQPLTVHPGWIMVSPATCNCEAKTPLTVMLGPAQQPAVCPACMNVYGITRIQYHPAKNVGFQMEVAIIGKAQREVSDQAVAENVTKITESVN